MNYEIELAPEAIEEIKSLRKAGDKVTLKKIDSLLGELEKHPYTGTGLPKPLRENRTGQWSRRISQKHRLIYRVIDDQMIVFVLSTYGHYDDK